MADSLVIAERFELMGGAAPVQSDISELVNSAGVGASFRLLINDNPSAAQGYAPTWDLGTPQPVVDIVQTLMLDGERPFGARASNRTITLPIKITAPDQVTLTAAREMLMAAVDDQTFTLAYTPAATGLTTIFDCFRAQPAIYGYGFLPNQPQPMCLLTLTFQALPFGRSDPSALVQVPFASPLLGGVSAPPSPLVIDNFGTVSGSHWTSSSTQYVVGPHSARFTPPNGNNLQTVTYTKTGLTSNITSLPALSVWFGQSYDTAHWSPYAAFKSNVTLRWTLTDNGGHKLNFSVTKKAVPWSNSASTPKWTRLTANIPQGNASFNYTSVASYVVTVTNWSGGVTRMNIWLDSVTANPPSIANPASQRGVMYNIMGASGTARTPISCQFQLPQSGSTSLELQGSGLFWPPPGVTSVQAECIGAGGAGGSRTTSGGGGGGGGGEYAAEPALTVAAGTPVPYSCGASGFTGQPNQVVLFSQPGTGNWTCPSGVTTVKAECWGGGGTGGKGSGGGGGGEYAAEASLAVTAGKVYQFTVGIGGVAGSVSANHTGATTTFAGDSVTVTAHGGHYPRTGTTPGGIGGTGSSNTTHHDGGAGGTSPGYGGGGGGGSGGSAATGNTGSNGSGNAGGAGASAVTDGGAGGAGASNPGFGVVGSSPGGGGGGGYSDGAGSNFTGAAGGNGRIRLTYAVGGGSPVNGGNTTFGSAGTTGTVVTAHGGSSVALNTLTGGSGGTGSSNTTHHNGGAGFTSAGSTGGGGGGSGGSAAAGNAASSATGAAAVTDGGKGANGSTVANTGGDSIGPPGGGGGGADSTGSAVSGGSGGAGNIVVTWTPPIAPFSTLIAHTPGLNAPPALNPCVPINNTADVPSGTQYPVPSLVSGVNATFNGTYTVVLVNYVWDSPTVQRTITVTVNQFEYTSSGTDFGGSPSYPLSVTRTLTPSTDIVNGICILGELTLPVKAIDPSNTSGYFTVSITDSDQLDQFLDVVFLDTQGSTVIVNIAPGNTYINMFIDEPTPERDLGLVLGSDLDRSQAISVMDASIISGSPFYISPGDNLLFAYTTSGAPNLGVSYLPRWYLERLV